MTTEILQFDAVTLPATDGYDEPVSGIDFVLRAGECALIELEEERACPPFADTAEGLSEPASGRVLTEGRDWITLAPDEAVARRSGIGRVFERHAWVSNLDVDENVTLAQRHHTRRPPDEIRDEALRWAARFGRDTLPAVRPVWASRRDLMMAQWVRALLGAPRLIILEEPTRDMKKDDCDRLIQVVRERRAEGTAVMWLTSDMRLLNNESLDPGFRARVQGASWETLE